MFVLFVSNEAFVHREMAMSTIDNSNPPGRGKALTSTDLNTSFTEVNNAFPLDGDNVRDEGLDQPVFATYPSSGQSGLILTSADANLESSTKVVNANTAAAPAFTAPEIIHSWTKIFQVVQNDIIRVYWQFDHTVAGGTFTFPMSVPFSPDYPNVTAWVVWLEWQLGGTTWSPVPNQSDFEDEIITTPSSRYGSSSLKTYATTFVNHAYLYLDTSGPVIKNVTQPARSGYGSWCFQADANYNVTGLRLKARGLVQNFYNSTPATGSPVNSWELVASPAATYTFTINKSYLAYMVMRDR